MTFLTTGLRLSLSKKVDKEKFNEEVQKVLLELNAKDVFTQAAAFERAYGWSIVILRYQDKASTLKDSVFMPEKIDYLEAYEPTKIVDVEEDEDRNSLRSGLPQIYKIRITERQEDEVHHSPAIYFATRLLDHP